MKDTRTKAEREFDEHFGREMQRLTKKMEKIRAFQSGNATVTIIHVKQSRWVERHRRGAHDRILIKATVRR